MSEDVIKIKKVKRKGETCWVFGITVAKKQFWCESTYKTARSAARAGANFVKRYVQE